MSAIHHEQQLRTATIEQRRDSWHVREEGSRAVIRAQAEELYREFDSWQRLYPKGSTRDYVTWWNYGKFNGNFYTKFYAGCALRHGFRDEGLTTGDLKVIGQEILDGKLPQELRRTLDEGGMDAIRAGRNVQHVTSLQIPSAASPQVRQLLSDVSELDGSSAPEAAATVLLSFAGADPVIQHGLIHQFKTGEPLMDSLLKALEEKSDYRRALKALGCVFCGYKGSGVQLHHQKVEADDRNRSFDLFVGTCERHHIARPGDSTDSVHAYKFEELKNDPTFWRNAFRNMALAAEAARSKRGDDHDDAPEPEPAQHSAAAS